MRAVYSDPYLKALLKDKPKEAAEYFDLISNSKFKDDLALCLETPPTVLAEIGIDACINPNFPEKELDRIVKSFSDSDKSIWSLFSSPKLTKKHILILMELDNPNVRGLALAHDYGNQELLLNYIKETVNDEQLLGKTYVLDNICSTTHLNEELFQYLVKHHETKINYTIIGNSLWKNPFLTVEQRALLVLSDVQPGEESNRFWEDIAKPISSLSFLYYFKYSAYYDEGKVQSVENIPDKFVKYFADYGHPLASLLPIELKIAPTIDQSGFHDLWTLMHRLFWTELCEREDFEIYRRNAYRTDDLFISHPILGREFEEGDIESSTSMGGVFIFSSNFDWLIGEEELHFDDAIRISSVDGYSTMVSYLEDYDFENLGWKLLVLTSLNPALADTYGFQLSEKSEEFIIDGAYELAESDDFSVTAELNPNFPEMLSWSKLPEANKRCVFEFLKLGFSLPESKIKNDAIHFLGCMALHAATPEALLNEIQKLGVPLVDEIIATR